MSAPKAHEKPDIEERKDEEFQTREPYPEDIGSPLISEKMRTKLQSTKHNITTARLLNHDLDLGDLSYLRKQVKKLRRAQNRNCEGLGSGGPSYYKKYLKSNARTSWNSPLSRLDSGNISKNASIDGSVFEPRG